MIAASTAINSKPPMAIFTPVGIPTDGALLKVKSRHHLEEFESFTGLRGSLYSREGVQVSGDGMSGSCISPLLRRIEACWRAMKDILFRFIGKCRRTLN